MMASPTAAVIQKSRTEIDEKVSAIVSRERTRSSSFPGVMRRKYLVMTVTPYE
jgi:hypothetical protein